MWCLLLLFAILLLLRLSDLMQTALSPNTGFFVWLLTYHRISDNIYNNIINLMNIYKIVAAVIGFVVTASVSWYFLYSLPRTNSLKLELERDKFNQIKEKDEKIESEKRIKNELLGWCVEGADDEYWDWMRTNGTENADGTIWGSDYHWDMAAKRKKAALDECYKQYK